MSTDSSGCIASPGMPKAETNTISANQLHRAQDHFPRPVVVSQTLPADAFGGAAAVSTIIWSHHGVAEQIISILSYSFGYIRKKCRPIVRVGHLLQPAAGRGPP